MEGFCRGCLIRYEEPADLIPYSEKNRRLFIYSTGIQVKRNDTFTFQLCKDCYTNMKESCKFKKVCRISDKKFKNYMAMKEDDDAIDFCTFLKNNDESLTLKLPALAIGRSTPEHQKIKDDDNESTCASIKNFMSDILQGEEVPDTEARIIKELFEEEADVLDDSLDSHWLQDEEDNMSIATDFRMDFSFSPFSTPHSINNDRCYTPRKISDEKYTDNSPNKYCMPNMPLLEEDECAMDIDQVPMNIPMDNINLDIYRRSQENNDILLSKNNDLFSKNKDIKHETNCEDYISIEKNDLINNKEMELDITLDKAENVLFNKQLYILNVEQTLQIQKNVQDDAILVKDLLNIDEDSTQEFISPTEIETDFYKMADEQTKKEMDKPIIKDIKDDLDYYVNKVEMKRKQSENTKCSIDRNLELALANEQNNEFSLEQLITSPRVSINSGASTPTIRNIIFGNQTPKYQNTENHVNENNLQVVLIKEDDVACVNEINAYPFSLSGIQPVSILIEKMKPENLGKKIDENVQLSNDKKEEINVNTDNSVNQINTPTNKSHTTCKHLRELRKEIKNKDITTLIEDYVTNVYDKTENNSSNNDEIDSILATVLPDIEIPEGFETTDSFKKPTPPDEQYDLDNLICKICDKQFKLEVSLRIHFTKIHKIKIKPRKRVYKTEICPECGKQFQGRANLIKHSKDVHSNVKRKHVCSECFLDFKSRYSLDIHRRTHRDFLQKHHEKFLCMTCGKYLNLSNYNLHQLKHNKIYRFKCVVCDKQFPRQWELDRHMNTHNKEKPFECTFCSKGFSRRDLLKVHVQEHSGYIFSCDECGKRFKTKNAIRKHLITTECPCPNVYEQSKVSLSNIIFTPMKDNKLTKVPEVDDKIPKLNKGKPRKRPNRKPLKKTENKTVSNNNESMITSDEQMKSNDNCSNNVSQTTESTEDTCMNRSNNQPVNSIERINTTDDDEQTMSSDKQIDKNEDEKIHEPIQSTDEDPLKVTDITVKIEPITIDIEEIPNDETADLTITADSPISVSD